MQPQRGDEKLRLILAQIGSVRSRLNALAIQQGLFESLSLVAGTAALALLAAFLLAPIEFLCAAAVLAAVLSVGIFRAIRRAWRLRASSERAARIADERAALKGRLATVFSVSRIVANPGRLWPYLLEDTFSLSEQFALKKIEPRRISRSVYRLAACCVLAAMVAGFALMNRRMQQVAKAPPEELEADINDLDVRPADADLAASEEITGDADTMRKLAERLATAEGRGQEPKSTLDRLTDRARHLAGKIQEKLTGQKSSRPRIKLRLTDSGAQSSSDDENAAGRGRPKSRSGDQSGQFERQRERAGNEHLPPLDSSPGQAADREQEGFDAQSSDQPKQGAQPSQRDSSMDAAGEADRDDQRGGGGGSAHGSGSDPQHLFGKAEEPPLGSQGFEIMIEARPAERGARGPNRSYLPPKVRASLNPSQHPDEPIARGIVPDDDRTAIKRVFDR